MYQIGKIAVEQAAYAFDKLYSYLIPDELGEVAAGCRVVVPFGRGNRKRTGVVVEMGQADTAKGIKPIASVLDQEPLLGDEGLMLLRYLKEHTFCTWFDALRLLIPAGIGILLKTMYGPGNLAPGEGVSPLQLEIVQYLRTKRSPVEQSALLELFDLAPRDKRLHELVEAGLVVRTELIRQRVLDEKVTMVRLREGAPLRKLTPKQTLVIAFLEESETASLKEVCYYTGVTRAVVDNLFKVEQVEYFDAVQMRSPFQDGGGGAEVLPQLSPEQEAAYQALKQQMAGGKPAPALLHGVTGSGKTQVFLKLIQHATDRGKSALVLVPEISLTAQTVDSFRRRFGEAVAVLHSGLSLGERMDEWKRIKMGEATIVVGTRSAVFAPLTNLGLVVIDEEQEHTYQSDKSPRFHAREVALRRCGWHGAMLLLASATPSVESYYHARQGRYQLVTLEERFNQTPLPDVYTVNMGETENLGQNPAFSQVLLDEMRYNLDHGEQSILLLNRRGYSTVVKCSSCGEVADCPNCSISMTYHTANDSLLCHYCGYMRHKADSCHHCGSNLIRYSGAGTQKLEQELKEIFPEARIVRVDMDTTMTKFSHQRIFSAFAAGEYDIMIGTQMVAKGLNFPDVTLVGVLSADQSLYAGDFRSFERSFSLLTQVVGRCGRGDKRGRAVVQTFSPENPVIQLAAAQRYEAFYGQEIGSRKLHLYPPFCTMAGIGFVGEDHHQVQQWAGRFLEQFRRVAGEEYPTLPIRALGPSPADIVKAAGKYRYKLILKCRNSPATRALLAHMLEWFYAQCKTVSVFVDMHYDGV